MKRICSVGFYLLLTCVLLAPWASSLRAQDDDEDDELSGERMPMYFYVTASVNDQVNISISEDRLRRMLPMLEKHRKTQPGLTATIFFSGAVSEALAARNSQTHIVDFVLDYVRRGVIEVGYDGTYEPTKQMPLLDLSLGKTPTAELRWRARGEAARQLLTDGRDPVTGAPRPGSDGGLKKMQQVFGQAACITGITLSVPELFSGSMAELGSDSEIVHQIRQYNKTAIMFGLPDENPLHAVTYRGLAAALSKDLSPVSQSSPELFWQEGVLRTSESSLPDNHLFHASDGPDAFNVVLGRLDRSKIRIIHVEIGNQKNYLTKAFTREDNYPPVKFAYAHPDQPQLPAEARRPASEVDAAFAKEEALIQWLAEDYTQGHPKVAFASSTGLKKLTPQGSDYDVRMSSLRSALGEALKTWGNGPLPPKYLEVDGHYLSLAEMFQVSADALKEVNRSGKLPQSVRVSQVYGPLETINDPVPVLGEVTVAAVARVAASLTDRLHDDAWKPVPTNAIPSRVKLDALDLNPAQFLRLMAEAIVTPSPETKLNVKETDMFWGRDVQKIRQSRSLRDLGVAWTYKPAVFTERVAVAAK